MESDCNVFMSKGGVLGLVEFESGRKGRELRIEACWMRFGKEEKQ